MRPTDNSAGGAIVDLRRIFVTLAAAVGATGALAAPAGAASIGFETPAVVDPIHTFGEPSDGVDPLGRVFASGPTGTGTQRSLWMGSADGGHTFRTISPGPPPSALTGTIAPPGGGDTDINFDSHAKQYFIDLYALTCNRTATTADAGATVFQSVYPAGCAGMPGADRPWLAVYDPPAGTPNQSAYKGPKPLIYAEYNNLNTGAQWIMSNSSNDSGSGSPGLNYVNAEQDGPGDATNYSPLGADGYPAIDQVTGKVFQAAGFQKNSKSPFSLLLNIGTPDASGSLKFLDGPPGDTSKLIHIADNLPASPDVLFTVVSLDSARNLHVAYAVDDPNGDKPTQRQVFVSAASAATGWTKWTTPVRVSDGSTTTGDAVNVFPWIQGGGPGRADAVWYGSDKAVDASSQNNQAWNVFMAQVVYPTDSNGGVTGAAPTVKLVKVSPHPAHYNDICLQGSSCVASQGNRNLADFFNIRTDLTGAAEVIYDDTSNGLAQPGFTPGNIQFSDHAGAPVVTLARQSSGPGLFGANVTGPTNAPVTGMHDPSGDAKFPVIGGTNQPGMDILDDHMSLSGSTLTVTMSVVDLAHPSDTASAINGTSNLDYVTRWQMGNVIYYAEMQNTSSNSPTFFAGKAQSVDLCSVSACFPHVITYGEPGSPGASSETGSVHCPSTPSIGNPCTVTITVKAADVGSPTATSLLEEVGGYAFASSHPEGSTTNAQALADNVPIEIDGACCFNFNGTATGELGASQAIKPPCVDRRKFTFRIHQPKHGRVIQLTVLVNGKRVKRIKAHRITRFTLKKLPKAVFTVEIIAKTNLHTKTISTRRFRGCRKTRPHTRVKGHHRRRHHK